MVQILGELNSDVLRWSLILQRFFRFWTAASPNQNWLFLLCKLW